MNNSIRIAVCDDLKTERQKIILLLSSYLDQNNLYAEIDEFESGETFLSSDTLQSYISGYFHGWIKRDGNCKKDHSE